MKEDEDRWLYSSLTPKQGLYISELASGLDTLQIAARHSRSHYTVRNTITKARERVGAESTINLVAQSISKGWIVPEDDEIPIVYIPHE